MAYAFTVSEQPVNRGGVLYSVFTIVETDVSPTDTWEVDVPLFGRVTGRTIELTEADLASTVTPLLGYTAGGNELPVSEGSALAGADPQRFVAPDRKLYGASVVDAHADTVTTTLIVERG